MSVLTEWNGKIEECKVKYELVIPENDLLIDSVDVSSISSSLFETDYTLDHKDISCTKLNKSEKADRIDYEVAIASGLIAGIIDSLWVGSFDYKRANAWGKEEIEKYVKHVAKKAHCDKKDFEKTIEAMEKKAPFVGDKYKDPFGGGLYHHLRDFGHHFSIFGLAFSLLTQFTGYCYGTNKYGKFDRVEVSKVYREEPLLMGRNFHERVFLGTIQWYLHVVSDMAGSRDFAGQGTGIPGPVVSSMKMMATLPIFKMTDKKGHRMSAVLVQKLTKAETDAEEQMQIVGIETIEKIDLDDYEIVSAEFFAQVKEPAFTINVNKITANAAAVRMLPEVDYVKILVNQKEKKLVLKPCDELDISGYKWVRTKDDRRYASQRTGEPFVLIICKLMGWNPDYRYKIMGKKNKANGEDGFSV